VDQPQSTITAYPMSRGIEDKMKQTLGTALALFMMLVFMCRCTNALRGPQWIDTPDPCPQYVSGSMDWWGCVIATR